VARIVESLDGLSLLGSGGFGPLTTELPSVLWAQGLRPPSEGVDRPIELAAGSPPGAGERRLTLRQASAEWTLDFPIPSPEVSGEGGSVAEVAPKAWSVHWPLSGSQWDRVRAGRPELVILGNSRTLFAEGEPFVRAIGEIRTQLGAAPVLWTPRTALPHRLSALVWLSVDLLDTTAGLWVAAEGRFLDRTLGSLDAATSGGSCHCEPCRTGDSDRLRQHALGAYADELELVRSCTRAGRLRELVEIRQASEPLLAELLRYGDRLLGVPLETRVPVVGTGIRTYVLRESFRRPEVARYRRRFLERYRPPPSKRVLLVLPCSKTKPYRNSRSHRRFHAALADLPHLDRLHRVSVTSPLGLVPRELEDLYPARHYDIPVTGEWDEAERSSVREGLQHLLRTGAYDSVIVHLDPVEYSFLRDAFGPERPTVWTLTDEHTTAPPALQALREAASLALGRTEGRREGVLAVVREELAALAGVQFGLEAARLLFGPPVRLHGRPWFQRLSDGAGVDLATWQEQRALFQLTVAGGMRILPSRALEVEVDGAVVLTGDLFTPGVVRADPEIRIGDSVLLTREGRLLGVGEARLPGPLMSDLPRGLAVHVRHRAKGATGAPTAT
jgi:archaeosine synthase alpha-subunit